MTGDPGRTTRRSGRGPAYAAAVVTAVFAVPNVYWGLGGTAGLDTLGGVVEEQARAGDPAIHAMNWVAVGLKLLLAGVAIALVHPLPRVPNGAVRGVAWAGAVILVVYGFAQTLGVGLMYLGVLEPGDGLTERALLWRLLLWEPWFLVCGVLLGTATWLQGRRGRSPRRLRGPRAGSPRGPGRSRGR